MSLIDKSSASETAEHLLARLQTAAVDVEVETGCNTSTSVAYSANGLILRQRETVTTTEYRGLTKASAKLLEDLDSDNTTTAIWYKQIGNSGDYATVAITTGTRVDYVPSRVDEGDCWQVVKTETDYGAAATSGWTTTRPTVSSNGIVVSQSSSKTFLSYALGGAVFQNETVVVKEYPFLNYSEAVSKVIDETAAGSILRDEKLATQWSTTEGITAWKNVTVRGGSSSSSEQGTDKVPTMRYDGPERGWVVTVTETTYWGSSS
uniref:Uncharacterized protein n=1 Tax=uncultured bacterium fosmid pJB16B1 TaxID=1478054 RepID=A0A0H3U7C0_9BACT|nr:hypothetical protein [uncultured bacterium fosmid pJB16B1]